MILSFFCFFLLIHHAVQLCMSFRLLLYCRMSACHVLDMTHMFIQHFEKMLPFYLLLV